MPLQVQLQRLLDAGMACELYMGGCSRLFRIGCTEAEQLHMYGCLTVN